MKINEGRVMFVFYWYKLEIESTSFFFIFINLIEELFIGSRFQKAQRQFDRHKLKSFKFDFSNGKNERKQEKDDC